MWDNFVWQPERAPNKQASLAPPSYAIRYTVIENEPGIEITVCNRKTVDLSSLGGRTITFVVSTDADVIELWLGGWLPSLSITKANLDDETMEVDESTLSDGDRTRWNRFVSETICKEVKIKFLFTK
jgi:hypothetical protein